MLHAWDSKYMRPSQGKKNNIFWTVTEFPLQLCFRLAENSESVITEASNNWPDNLLDSHITGSMVLHWLDR